MSVCEVQLIGTSDLPALLQVAPAAYYYSGFDFSLWPSPAASNTLLVFLQERKVAVDSLRSVAGLLTEAYSPLHDIVFGRTDVPENHGLDAFFSIVKATADVRASLLCKE